MSTLDGLEARLEAMEQTMIDLAPILTEVGNEITSELRSNAPEGEENGGSLKSSISLSVQPTQFAISMNDYGVFQNYGVVGFDGGSHAKKPRGGQVKPDDNFPQGRLGEGGRYQFGFKQPSKGWGAYYTGFNKNIGWFKIDEITEKVKNKIQTKIIQAF